MNVRLLVITLLALLAFAGNSLLCRAALAHTAIDPVSFVSLRIASGALMLWLVVVSRKLKLQGDWRGALALFVYALAFACAYTRIPAGTGALLLFASIQISMILYGLSIGERLGPWQMLGLGIASGGLIVLMLPKAGAPPLLYGLLMIVSGVAWGAYSLLGRGVGNPLAATAGNFIRATPIALGGSLLALNYSDVSMDANGFALAVMSGAVTSGLGYVLWYAAVKQLRVTHAATIQLSVPLLTTLGGTLLLGEAITGSLVFASIAIVLGIALVVWVKKRPA